jgi:hypothetical protein
MVLRSIIREAGGVESMFGQNRAVILAIIEGQERMYIIYDQQILVLTLPEIIATSTIALPAQML